MTFKVDTSYGSVNNFDEDWERTEDAEVSQIIDYLGCGFFNIMVQMFCMSLYITGSCQLTLSSFLTPILTEEWDLNQFQGGIIGSSVFAGFAIGSLFFGYISDVLGRRFSLHISVTIGFVFAFVSCVCKNYYLFLAARVLTGVGIGGQNICISLLIEFLPTKRRGLWLILVHTFWSIGTSGMVFIAWVIFGNNVTFSFFGLVAIEPWMIFLFLCLYPYPFIFFLLCFTSESIRFHSLQRDTKEVKKTIRRIEFWNCKKLPVTWTLKHIQQSSMEESSGNDTQRLRKNKTKEYCRVFVVLLSCTFLWCCSTVIFFGATISQPKMFSSGNKYLGSLLSSIIELVGIFLPVPLVTFVRRKELLFLFSVLTGFCLTILAFPQIYNHFIASLVLCMLVRCLANASDAMMITLVEESIPTDIRSSGVAISDFVSKIVTIFLPIFLQVLPSVSGNLYIKILLYVASFCLGFGALVHPVESKGRILQETTV